MTVCLPCFILLKSTIIIPFIHNSPNFFCVSTNTSMIFIEGKSFPIQPSYTSSEFLVIFMTSINYFVSLSFIYFWKIAVSITVSRFHWWSTSTKFISILVTYSNKLVVVNSTVPRNTTENSLMYRYILTQVIFSLYFLTYTLLNFTFYRTSNALTAISLNSITSVTNKFSFIPPSNS